MGIIRLLVFIVVLVYLENNTYCSSDEARFSSFGDYLKSANMKTGRDYLDYQALGPVIRHLNEVFDTRYKVNFIEHVQNCIQATECHCTVTTIGILKELRSLMLKMLPGDASDVSSLKSKVNTSYIKPELLSWRKIKQLVKASIDITSADLILNSLINQNRDLNRLIETPLLVTNSLQHLDRVKVHHDIWNAIGAAFSTKKFFYFPVLIVFYSEQNLDAQANTLKKQLSEFDSNMSLATDLLEIQCFKDKEEINYESILDFHTTLQSIYSRVMILRSSTLPDVAGLGVVNKKITEFQNSLKFSKKAGFIDALLKCSSRLSLTPKCGVLIEIRDIYMFVKAALFHLKLRDQEENSAFKLGKSLVAPVAEILEFIYTVKDLNKVQHIEILRFILHEIRAEVLEAFKNMKHEEAFRTFSESCTNIDLNWNAQDKYVMTWESDPEAFNTWCKTYLAYFSSLLGKLKEYHDIAVSLPSETVDAKSFIFSEEVVKACLSTVQTGPLEVKAYRSIMMNMLKKVDKMQKNLERETPELQSAYDSNLLDIIRVHTQVDEVVAFLSQFQLMHNVLSNGISDKSLQKTILELEALGIKTMEGKYLEELRGNGDALQSQVNQIVREAVLTKSILHFSFFREAIEKFSSNSLSVDIRDTLKAFSSVMKSHIFQSIFHQCVIDKPKEMQKYVLSLDAAQCNSTVTRLLLDIVAFTRSRLEQRASLTQELYLCTPDDIFTLNKKISETLLTLNNRMKIFEQRLSDRTSEKVLYENTEKVLEILTDAKGHICMVQCYFKPDAACIGDMNFLEQLNQLYVVQEQVLWYVPESIEAHTITFTRRAKIEMWKNFEILQAAISEIIEKDVTKARRTFDQYLNNAYNRSSIMLFALKSQDQSLNALYHMIVGRTIFMHIYFLLGELAAPAQLPSFMTLKRVLELMLEFYSKILEVVSVAREIEGGALDSYLTAEKLQLYSQKASEILDSDTYSSFLKTKNNYFTENELDQDDPLLNFFASKTLTVPQVSKNLLSAYLDDFLTTKRWISSVYANANLINGSLPGADVRGVDKDIREKVGVMTHDFLQRTVPLLINAHDECVSERKNLQNILLHSKKQVKKVGKSLEAVSGPIIELLDEWESFKLRCNNHRRTLEDSHARENALISTMNPCLAFDDHISTITNIKECLEELEDLDAELKQSRCDIWKQRGGKTRDEGSKGSVTGLIIAIVVILILILVLVAAYYYRRSRRKHMRTAIVYDDDNEVDLMEM